MYKENSDAQGILNDKKITIETVKELWSKTYNTEVKPDWSHILP